MGRKPLNLKGLPCGLVTPEEQLGRDEAGAMLWRVVCECGTRRVLDAHTLVWSPPKTHLACLRERERLEREQRAAERAARRAS